MEVKTRISRSLQKRLVIAIVVASSAITTVFTAISFYMDYQVESRALEATFSSIERQDLEGLAHSLTDLNRQSVQSKIQEITGSSDIEHVMVFDEQGQLYAEAKAEQGQERIKSYLGLEGFFAQSQLMKTYPLIHPLKAPLQIGKLSVALTQQNMYVRLSNRASYFFLAQGCKTLLVSLLIAWICSLLVTQHLRHIVSYLSQYNFEAQKPEEPLLLLREPPQKADELDALVETLNILAARLHYFKSQAQEQIERKDQEIRGQRLISSNVAKLATLGEMAGGIAHEINNPLHIIKGYNDILVDQLGQGIMDREVLHRASLVIEKNSNRIGRIVSSLLMFSRKGDQEIFEFTNMPRLIDQVVSMTQALAENHGIRFLVEIDDIEEQQKVECNQVQIAQVLINIINNAIDAIVEKNIREPWIRVTGRSLLDKIVIEVIDCGEGIPDDVAAKVFEPFFTTKEVGKGTGLGLSVSFGIIEKHGGRLFLDKNSRHTSFVMELPYQHKLPESQVSKVS